MAKTRLAVVFGGSGFLGHAVVAALAARGYVVRVPVRDPEKGKNLKMMGFAGQIALIPLSLRADAPVAHVLEGADLVVNLVGILAEKGKNTFQAAHVETAARLARLARAAGVKNFIQVSALGADSKSASRYARSKALGEEAVRAFFPDAILLRPSVLFGPRDKFLMRFFWMARFSPFLPLIGGGKARFQPAHVGDVAETIALCAEKPEAKGRTFALGGPKIYSLRELMELVLKAAGLRRFFISLPWGLARIAAGFLEGLPNPPLTRDQLILLQKDNILGSKESSLKTFKDLEGFLSSYSESLH